jgi:hypothetical protein
MKRHHPRLNWSAILARGNQIVDTSAIGVTLRKLFYKLFSAGILRNTLGAYKTLSDRTAKARRAGTFPRLLDRTRAIIRPNEFDSALDALRWLARIYRHDRDAGQTHSLYLGVEKAGIETLLRYWFGHTGIPILPLGGYASQTFCDDVRDDIEEQGRPSVLIYAGDYDASGKDIPRDFIERVGNFDTVKRVALDYRQVRKFKLPEAPHKENDSRNAAFLASEGHLMQVELDALDDDDLRKLYADAIAKYWDPKIAQRVLKEEARERRKLEKLIEKGGRQ